MTCKVLLVEADDDLREMLLNVTGELCEIAAVVDAAKAIRALTADHFDIVILNMDLPLGDALSFADAAAARGCVVIGIPESPQDCKDLREHGYRILIKPFRIAALQALIGEVLASGSSKA